MEYVQGQIGRVFIARFDDSEDVLEGLKKIIEKENIQAGLIQLIGASLKSKVVLGPEKPEFPPVPSWWEFEDGRELVATGIFARENNEPKIHLHAGIGHYSETKVGCIREECKVFLTVEAVIQEIKGSNIFRKHDPKYNASLLDFGNS